MCASSRKGRSWVGGGHPGTDSKLELLRLFFQKTELTVECKDFLYVQLDDHQISSSESLQRKNR